MNGTEICNYADDAILYSCDREVKNVMTKTRAKYKPFNSLVPRKPRENKCHLIIFGTSEKMSIYTLEKCR